MPGYFPSLERLFGTSREGQEAQGATDNKIPSFPQLIVAVIAIGPVICGMTGVITQYQAGASSDAYPLNGTTIILCISGFCAYIVYIPLFLWTIQDEVAKGVAWRLQSLNVFKCLLITLGIAFGVLVIIGAPNNQYSFATRSLISGGQAVGWFSWIGMAVLILVRFFLACERQSSNSNQTTGETSTSNEQLVQV